MTSGYADHLVPLTERWHRDGVRVAIYGAGAHTDLLFREVPSLLSVHLVAFLDNDAGKQGLEIRGLPVHPPAWARGRADVVLCSSFVNEPAMAASVAGLGCEVVCSHQDGPPLPVPPSTEFHRKGDRRGCPAVVSEQGGFDVVILPVIDWYFRLQRPQQLALALAQRGHRVYYVRSTFHGGAGVRATQLRERLVEVTLPAARAVATGADRLDDSLLHSFAPALEAFASQHALADVVCLVDLPFWWPLAREMRDRLGWRVVYDCMDEHGAFKWTTERMLASEDDLVAGSDLVLASSQPLAARLAGTGAHVRLLPNGVDFDHFVNPPPLRTPAVSALPRPVIGYYGAVSDWFDTALLARLASARPSWSFLVIGGTAGADLSPLDRLSNIYRRPEEPYESLPALLHEFDVATIPFKRTKLTDATNPVKLYEYFAAGKPVVATRLTELQRFEPMLHLAATDEEWLKGLDAALAQPSTDKAENRRQFARENTWAARAATLASLCESLSQGTAR